MSWPDLAAAIPALPDGNCVGSHELFDPADWDEDRESVIYRFTAALALLR